MKKTKPMDIILIGAIFVIVGGIIGAVGTRMQNKKSSEKSDRIEATGNSTNELVVQQSNTIDTLRKELADKQTELITANDQILQLQKQLRNEITGGDTKPFLALAMSGKLKHDDTEYFILYFNVVKKGDFALQGVSGTVSDIWGRSALEKNIIHNVDGHVYSSGGMATKDQLNNWSGVKHFNLGSITEGKSYPVYVAIYIPQAILESSGKNLDFHYTVDIQWSNGSMLYMLGINNDGEHIILKSMNVYLNGKHVEDPTAFYSFGK